MVFGKKAEVDTVEFTLRDAAQVSRYSQWDHARKHNNTDFLQCNLCGNEEDLIRDPTLNNANTLLYERHCYLTGLGEKDSPRNTQLKDECSCPNPSLAPLYDTNMYPYDERSDHMSIISTAGHDMYVQQDQNYSHHDKPCDFIVPFNKEKAHSLAEVGSSVRFLAYAENGIKTEKNSSQVQQDIHEIFKCVNVDYQNEHTVALFMEVYGVWLSNGSIRFDREAGIQSIHFALATPDDIAWLRCRLDYLDVKYFCHSNQCVNHLDCIEVVDVSWIQWFFAFYGRACYHQKLQAKPALSAWRHKTSIAIGFRLTDQFAGFHRDVMFNPHTTRKCKTSGQFESAKCTKWLVWWILSLRTEFARAILRGVQCADGSECSVENKLLTASHLFRDQLVQLCLHAGYCVNFESCCMGRKLYTMNSSELWAIRYSSSGISNGRSAAPSRPVTLGKQKCGSKCEQQNNQLWGDLDVKTFKYSGGVWCVEMQKGFLLVRRAIRDLNGTITRASIPTIQGNCSGA